VRSVSVPQVLKAIAQNTRTIRTSLGISQEEAAHRAGIVPRLWQRVENADPITIKTLVAVAAALGVEPADLLKR
jgi:transcriptional regulator with XRE-family HTH domain